MAIRLPGGHEAAVGPASHRGVALLAAGGRVDMELVAHGMAGGIVALAIDAIVVAVLPEGLPGDGEAAIGHRGDGGIALGIRGVGVDAELRALRHAAAVVALGIDVVAAEAAAVLAI